MPYCVEIMPRAIKDLKSIDKAQAKIILEKIYR